MQRFKSQFGWLLFVRHFLKESLFEVKMIEKK